VIGLLLARRGAVQVPLPGGDDFGARPIQRLAAMAAASVVRTRSMARFRSGACRDVATARP